MFGKKSEKIDYDPVMQEPVLKKSICTGETTAGLLDKASGKYRDLRLIKNSADAAKFMEDCGVSEVRTIY